MFVQTKLQFQAVLDQVFPEYSKVFGDLYSDVSLKTLQAFATSEDVLKVDTETLTTIGWFCGRLKNAKELQKWLLSYFIKAPLNKFIK